MSREREREEKANAVAWDVVRRITDRPVINGCVVVDLSHSELITEVWAGHRGGEIVVHIHFHEYPKTTELELKLPLATAKAIRAGIESALRYEMLTTPKREGEGR